MCFAGVCQVGIQYEGTYITADNWFYNISTAGSSGIIGMGPNSPYWSPYIDSSKAVYSVVLARTKSNMATRGRLLQTTETNNVTFGYANDAEYIGNESLTVTSMSNFTYNVSSLGLGPVYMTNGIPTSYYY